MVEQEQPKEEERPLSIVEEAKLIRDEIIKQKEEVKAEREKLQQVQAEAALSSTAGGHIEAPKIDPQDLKVNEAKEFFKGTELETAIKKANEKK